MEFVTGFKRCMFNHESKVQNLKKQLDKLTYERDRTKHFIEVAMEEGEEIDQGVKSWVTHAEETMKQAGETVKDLEVEAKKRCFIGQCPNFKSLNLLHKRGDENIRAVMELIEQAESHKLNNKSNIQNLENQAEAADKSNVQNLENQAEAAENRNRKTDVEQDKKTSDEVGKVNKVEDKAENRSLVGLYPKPKSPYRVSGVAEDETKAISKQMKQSRFDKGVFPAGTQETESRATQGYEAFESRKDTMEKILKALQDPDLKTIGVFGMTGIGKTMLVKEVARRAKEESLFDEVAMATVSRNPNIKEIQGKIADALGLKFDEESVFARAKRLQQWLKKEDKRALIVLDDLWHGKRLELEEVGIDFEGYHYQNIASEEDQGPVVQNVSENDFQKFSAGRFKILLTSTTKEVLTDMKTARMFEVQVLTDKEATDWFQKIVGDTAKQPDNQQIATRVVTNCSGFPVAISAIAIALRIRAFSHLVGASQNERKPISTKEEKLKNVYLTIDLSYRLLEKLELQSFFQLCALLPQGSDIHVSDLLRYNLGLKIARNVSTLEEARKSMNTLKDAGLLLSSDNDDLVKMHDIVRDVAIWIASEEKRMFVIEGEIHMEELLKQGKLKNCPAISLPYCNIRELSPKLECPRLKLLLLLNKNPSLKVPDTFFEEMKELLVLDLAGMNFPSLPLSFTCLRSLKDLEQRKNKQRQQKLICHLNTSMLQPLTLLFGISAGNTKTFP
ncbi:disease resistance protein At4g27190-like [Durio zibethinus]|uniref:Disease resistance protein At4g27190-like n=1 Tax=Durio zibethinus TaxID=66656 RepID=A0A6P5YPS6_DURZI|nr:disease resistance protein At4g27190-like [Durio zibethinus]